MKRLEKIYAFIPILLQITLNLALVIVGLTLVAFLIREAGIIFTNIFFLKKGESSYDMTQDILTFFLYFEFIALIIKYFESQYHFPLRYFIYIGITAIIRFIILDHSSAVSTIILSGAILLLVMALFIANTKILKRENGEMNQKY
ncbi:phosphate-starvation-inducible protein PsiE [Listeria welshimeri]|uniref:Protein PsiE homolog n=2 Tax=Listeria welshimeri TaxID=1643 RepID=A0A7X0W5R4_LISWE|nr:phosphate-starvation-inducible protein PsiE [Listeria monocytogenes]MBC1321299.1 phosphate-starvation-inducible protein PsiE [Listeria welshimeri]MBC1322888.1 phosphate-starvation-inducible protein PsiE [Listeria welshimeri]MBC2347389.1 phosphate-starvation-inducible protein PsiE [Listeria welshimeri]MBC2360532.1 phosphate-starvation-inducible protein PsiE [Listeria welshimeri]